jgi:hypothetical protein
MVSVVVRGRRGIIVFITHVEVMAFGFIVGNIFHYFLVILFLATLSAFGVTPRFLASAAHLPHPLVDYSNKV